MPLTLDRPDVPAPPDIDPPEDDDGGGGEEPVRWVTVATFTEPTRAHFTCIRLEAAGIPCSIADEIMGMSYPLAIGGIKVQVPQEERERAMMVLETPIASVEPLIQDPEEEPADLTRCPACGSRRVAPRPLTASQMVLLGGLFLIFVPVALLVAPLVLLGLKPWKSAGRRRCESCGYEWNLKRGFPLESEPTDAEESSSS